MRNRIIGLVAAAVAGVGAAASAAQASELPVIYNGTLGYAHVSATASPPGANDFSCKPSAAHPRPVILVHGTFADMSDSWQALSPLLYDHGYCVFALNYGAYAGAGSLGIYATANIAHPRKNCPASSTACWPPRARARWTSWVTPRAG